MKERAFEPLDRTDIPGDAPAHPAVESVAHNRVADRAQVHADLVRSPGVDGDVAQGHARGVLGSRDAGHGTSGPARPRRHLLPIDGVAPDRGIDTPARLNDAPDERDVLLLDLAIVKLARELVMSGVALCHDHDARRAAIEAV